MLDFSSFGEPIDKKDELDFSGFGEPVQSGRSATPMGRPDPRRVDINPNSMTGDEYVESVKQRNEQTPGRTLGGTALDAGITFLKGAIGLPEAVVGLLDIPTQGRVGKLLEDAGFRPKEAREILDTYMSEAQQAASRKVKQADGFVPTIKAALENPSTIVTAAGESLPQMLGGAGVARGLMAVAPKVAPLVAGAIGEGVLGAGSAASQIRGETEDGLLTPGQSLSAVGSGVGTAIFGVAGGRLANKLGFDDIDTMLASGVSKGPAKSVGDFAKRVVGSGISEGAFEELPQSVQEQMWQNYALDKPITEGVGSAAAMGLLTGTAMGAAGGGLGMINRQGKPEPTYDAAQMMRDRGFTLGEPTNFTPPGSPTQQAGLVDIVVPVPTVNPDTEREFGLDKLRMGAGNVGTTGAPGNLAARGSDVAGSLDLGSLGDAGLPNVDTRGAGGGSAGVNAPAGGTTVPAGSGAGEPLANLSGKYNNGDMPVEQWFGRRGDGYQTEADAQQALPGRQRMFPDLSWKIEAMPSGKFRLAGYSQETNLGTQTAQAQQGQTQGQAPVAGSPGAGVGVPLATGGVTPALDGTTAGVGELALQPSTRSAEVGTLTTPEGAQAAGLNAPIKLAPPAPLRTVGQAMTRLQNETGVNVEIDRAPLTEQQQAASGLARMLGKTLTFLKADTPKSIPNGFVIPDLSTKDIFVANDADDAPLSVVVHEVYHTLPDDKRQTLNAQLLTLFREDKRGDFATQFGYDPKNDKLIDEEIPAFMAQAISKRADFWEQLRDKMGNREFAGLAKVILDKLTSIVTGARDEYGDGFVKKYIKDVEKARDLLSTAYAEAMQAQGLTPDTQAMPMAASNRSRVDMDFKDVIKRTPELQEGMAKLQAGEITKEDYDRLVNEYKPVEPYKSVPAPVTPEAAKFALANGKGQSQEKAAKFGLPSQEMKAGEATQLRLDIPSYSEHGAWVVSVHRPEGRSFGAGKVVGYEPVASVQNAEFGMLEKSAAKIAAGSAKGTIATIMGNWKPTTPAEAKMKADQALKSKDWVQVGMDPERHSYFYDRKTMEPVTAADEVIQIGPLVLAKNPTYGKKSDFMFSNRARSVADYDAKRDNYNKANDMLAMLRESVPADVVTKADEFVAQYYKDRAPAQVSPQDRLKAEILLKPKMQAAEKVKPEFDQKVLNIVDRTGAIGQMLAPVKGMKRAAEKLAVEEGFQVDNIKDLVRATIVVNGYQDAKQIVDEIGKEFKILRVKNRSGTPLSGELVQNDDRQKFGGYADVLINVQMPDGTVGEIQINTPAMLSVKDNQGHKLYEAARDLPEGSAQRAKIEDAMRVLYDAAFLANSRQSAAQARKAASDMGAPLAGRAATGTSSSPESASLKTAPSGKATNSSPENEATNLQSAGKAAGSFIEGSPDEPSISQNLYRSNRAGKYSYEIDNRGRLIVSGDTDRIRFLAKQAATGTVNKDKTTVTFKAVDADAVIDALANEPKPNKRVASAIVRRLGLSDAELKSTSLEFQTGEPGDRAFSGPLQGGIPETVKFLEDRRRQSGLRLLDISNTEDQDVLAKLIAAEALGAIRSSGNALEWYDETIARTLAMAAIKYEELADDVNAQKAFRLAIAIASQGLNVENNLAFAMRQYDAFRKDGVYPEVGEGESAEAMAGNFRLANALRKEMGPDLFRRFLETEFTIGELNQAGFEPGGELIDEKVLGSSVFGPKIGFGFYSNLNGNFEPVTMDMWFMRTIGRLTGNLRSFDAEKFGAQLDKFRAAFGATGDDGIYSGQFDSDLVERARTDQESAIELARQVKKAHEQDFRKNRAEFDAGKRKKTKLVYAAETMIQSVDKPKDVPASGGERRLLREVVRKAVSTLEQAYGQRIPPAAMQALIWYPEQELYKALGVKLSVTSQDYAGAIEKILTEEGYDGTELRTAAESGSRRVRQANGRDARGEVEGDGQGTRGSRSIQGQERDAFIRSRYERTQLEKERLEPKRRGVIFEVAPDPNNERLTNAWRNLTQAQRLEISERVARDIVPKVLAQFKTEGIVAAQVGSYLDDTNPSFTVLLNKGDPVEIAKALGFVLAQDSMMVVSPKEFKGGSSVGAIAIQLGDKTPEEVDAIYQTLRGIEVNGQKPIGGQSMANGVMTVLNYSDVPTKQLAILIDQKLNKGYTVLTRDVFAAFPEKKEYDYASEANDGRGSQADLRRGARALRDEATAAVERELGAAGIQFSNRVTETPAFKRWFGESKVVDADGEPLVMYHSTTSDFNEFDTTRQAVSGAGSWFSVQPKYRPVDDKEGARVMPVYLSLQNPKVFDFAKESTDYRKENLIKQGYDGVVITINGDLRVAVAFEPTQIKSAIGNSGEFDANNPSIVRSNRVTETPAFKRWFDDSKVVDANDKPMVVYHGSSKAFDVFDMSKAVDGAHWFTPNESHAASFGKNVSAVYLSIKNPLEISQDDLDAAWDAEHPDGEQDDRNLLPRDFVGEFVKQARDEGYDGLIIRDMGDRDIQSDMYLPLASTQIKSATDNSGEFDASNPSILRSNRVKLADDLAEQEKFLQAKAEEAGYKTIDEFVEKDYDGFAAAAKEWRDAYPVDVMYSNRTEKPEFFSQLQRSIEQVPDRLATQPAPQWKAWIASNAAKLGVKKEEIEWSGVNDYLDLRGKDKVSKDDLAQYLAENGVQVDEVTLTSPAGAVGQLRRALSGTGYSVEEDYGDVIFLGPDEESLDFSELPSNIQAIVNQNSEGAGASKYDQYTLPGGENYREVLITLPKQIDISGYKITGAGNQWYLRGTDNQIIEAFGSEAEAQAKLVSRAADRQSNVYRSSHWDQPNIVAHLRVNDRTDADGNKVLFVEEIQSDWGQEGKKKGFATMSVRKVDGGWALFDGNEQAGPAMKTKELAEQDLRDTEGSKIPAAPFVTKTEGWLNLALKRIAMMAVEGDYDKVAFVNGEQSADRYDLSKQIEYIGYDPKTKILEAYDKNRRKVLEKTYTEPSDLPEYIGKEVADRLLASPQVMGKHTLEGENLKVGGEGMKTFYDKLVPQAISKLLPKLGGEKLGTVNVNAPDRRPMGGGAMMLLDEDKRLDQPGFDVTDKMRDVVSGGVPMFSNRAREGWIVGRDELGRPTFGAGARAYRLVADLANNVLGRIGLKPISTDLGRAMRQMKVEIAKAREMTVDAAEQLGKLSQQEREMISDVIEGELKRGAKPPKRVLELAASMQGIMSEQTAELVRLGMLSEEAAGRWDGKYLPRFYESKLKDEGKAWLKAAKSLLGRPKVMQGIGGSNLKGRGLFQTIPVEELEAWLAEGWEERDPNFDPDTDTEITVWRDYTRQERDDMGEIRDSMFRFVMGYNKSQRDIALGRLYENLADTVASKKEKPGFVQVPRSNVEDTYARRYGKLAGMWVPQEVLDHLAAFDQSQQNELLKMYLKGMSMWKEGKTVLNPVSHANNIMSNITMAHFAGVSYWDVNKYIGATRDLIKRDPMVTEAEDAGLWTGTMTQAELVQLLPDQLKVLAAKAESKSGKAVESVWNAMSFWLRKPLGKAYEAEDLFFRYLIYRDARERGLEPADAVDFAQKYIFTYDDLPKNARRIRDFALPFFAYTYKVVPTMAETALKYPWRYAAPAAALYTINAAMYGFAAGADDDWWELIKRYVTDEDFRKKAKEMEADERKNLPEWMKGASLTLGTSKAIRLGMDEATGLPVFLDVSRVFPGGDLFDAHNNAGGVPMLAPLTPNTPVLTVAAAMLFNKDTFRGKDIVKESDTDAEAARKRASWMWQQVTPAIAVGNTHFERAMNVIANQVGEPVNLGFAEYTGIDRQGQPVQAGYAAMQTVGIKARPIDLELSAQIQKSETQKLIREIGAEISSLNRMESRGAITSETAERQRDVQREKRQRLKQGLTVDGEEKE